MPSVGFEHKIPAFERAKTVHALDREATVRIIIYGSETGALTGNMVSNLRT
jgi:hypothetical protein